MNNIEIRHKLHQYIETVQDKKLKAIFTIIENEIEEMPDPWEDPTFVEQIKKREESYLNGSAKIFSWDEIQQRAKSDLQKARFRK